MAEPEVGDKASWNWNGSAPSGEVAEKKTEGEVAVQSKRGNTIKKDAKPNDPAIHLARPGNDVVKNQSELQVEEKKSGDDGKEDEKEDKDDEGANGEAQPAKKGEKRKAEDDADAEGDGEGAKKARGRPKGAAPKKAEPKAKKEKAAKPTAATNGEKKSRGRPKGAGSGGVTKEKKEKKEKPQKAAAPPTGIGKRTRSSKK